MKIEEIKKEAQLIVNKVKKAGFEHIDSYFQTAKWAIIHDCIQLVKKIKLKNCVIDHASASSSTTIALSILDNNQENYMICTMDMNFENGMVKTEVALRKTPRSNQKMKEQSFVILTRMTDSLTNLLYYVLYPIDQAYENS